MSVFQLPYEDITPVQAAVGVVQKVNRKCMGITYPSAVNSLAYTRSYNLFKCSLKHVLVLFDFFLFRGYGQLFPSTLFQSLLTFLRNAGSKIQF